ncbi:chaperone modulator CbpM [Snodgrassella alvi]|jgi:chaperone modulatory protein CbpM|uniref:MerR family transcriptional regulator n=1 Tax=Snodgrassella alvi TaxID=1196083 RepID=A0A2N9XZW7_9NEIS|nr:chaperone modulator CbpM [Snodgrassella alvi]PIT57465.1 MerR family transcriptional regulator [Snodgrassella alvi]
MNNNQQDIELSFDDLVRACDNQSNWILSLIAESVIPVEQEPQLARYTGYHMAIARRAWRIHRDFDASASATALILQLLDEVEELRRRN